MISNSNDMSMQNQNDYFCKVCGTKLEASDRFCKGCGRALDVVQDTEFDIPFVNSTSERTILYEGTINKCPSCGEVLGAFTSNCTACGHEIRGAASSNTTAEFMRKIEQIESKVMPEFKGKRSILKALVGKDLKDTDEFEQAKKAFEEQKEQEKIALIKNYAIPNTKEDITEFIFLAASSIDAKKYNNCELTKAWISKLEQVYQKAVITIGNQPDFQYLHNIYSAKLKQVKQEETKAKRSIFLYIGAVVGWFIIMFIIGALGS